MASIEEMKAEQREEEEGLLEDLVDRELEAVASRLNVSRRGLRHVPDDRSDAIVFECFLDFTAALAVEYGQTKEEFLRTMEHRFSVSLADAPEEEEGSEVVITESPFDRPST